MAVLLLGASVAHAQGDAQRDAAPDTAPDTARAPADRLAGRARIGLGASAERLDKGLATTYAIDASVAPFLGEHLQIGIAPTGRVIDDRTNPAFHTVGGSVAARYIFGGDPHWRGFVGVFGGEWGASYAQHTSQLGAQLGALYFLTPALAIRAGVDFRSGASYTAGQPRSTLMYVVLDPYMFGAADEVSITPAGFGTLDISASYAYERLSHDVESGLSGTIAPYLTRWAQLGVDGEADGSSQGLTAHRLRGFGRVYLPLGVRTQPFGEGFAETATLDGEDGGLTSYGGTIGIRHMLNGNVSLDVGVQRRLHPRERLGPAELGYWYREPGTTALIVGMMTRIGRTR